MPTPNDRPSIQGLVRADLEQREQVGIHRYGTPLQPFNGRDALRDAYEEALDLGCYLRQAIEERVTSPAPEAPTEFLVWSNEQRKWWKPNHRGYTLFIEEAGRYSQDAATRICEDANLVANEHVPDGYCAEMMIPVPAAVPGEKRCSCDPVEQGRTVHHPYCELNHPHHPCNVRSCRYAPPSGLDEIRRSIVTELDGMVSEFIHPNEFGGYDVDYGQLADVVMPVLAEASAVKDAEIAGLRRQLDGADIELSEVDTLNRLLAAARAELARLREQATVPDNPAIYVSIGNSDDKLTQADWSTYLNDLRIVMEHHVVIHGIWHSAPDSEYQNACICGTIPADAEESLILASLRGELGRLREHFRQDSIALAVARTEFL